MPERVHRERPTVVVALAQRDASTESRLRQVLAGIEEEGVPSETLGAGPVGAQELAGTAAERSRLEVGVGLAADGAGCVTHRRLLPGRSVREAPPDARPEELRALGRTAARMVVGLPLTD